MRDSDGEFSGMNSVLNQHQMLPFSNFDPTSSHEDFLQQMLSSVPSSAAAAAFPWADDHPPPGMLGNFAEQSTAVKMRHQQISDGAAKALMLQQQLLLSRGIAAANADHNDVLETPSSDSANLTNDASINALFDSFVGSNGQSSHQSPQFHHPQGVALQQGQNYGSTPAINQPAASGSTGGGSAEQPKQQRVRAKRGQATDPHSIAERLRRERIAERMKALQELVPNGNKTDKASMLDEIIDYVKFLQLQVKVLSMSRLGGAAAVAPLVTDKSPEGRNSNGTASSSNDKEGMTVTENQVAKMMEEDLGSAMQYLQGKGLCLMPISLATAISTTTSRPSRPPHSPLLQGGDTTGPLSPSLSVLTVQSATTTGNAAAKSL